MDSIGHSLRLLPRKSPRQIAASLRLLARAAYDGVPFYRRTWTAANVAPEDIQGVEDLRRLPLVTKDNFLACGVSDRLHRSAQTKNTISRITSGTTGAVLEVFMSRAELWFRQYSFFHRLWRDTGFRFPLTIVQAGTWIPLEHRSRVERRLSPVGRVLHISRHLPIAEQIDAIVASSPTVLTGCPSVLETLACAAADQPGTRIQPELVMTRGEVLRPATRQLLSRVFSSPVTNYYSCEEAGLIAWQCPTSSEVMHVNQDACILEVIDENGNPSAPGEDGIVVVTNLFNRTMPLIRYVLGDQTSLIQGVPTTCQCKSNAPSICSPAGRSDDFILLPDGKRLSPRFIADLVYDASALHGTEHPFFLSVRDYQVVQDASDLISIRYLTHLEVPAFVASLLAEGCQRLHPSLRCEVRAVEILDTEESGKRRRIVSHV